MPVNCDEKKSAAVAPVESLYLMDHYAMALRNVYDELFELNLTHNTYAILHHADGKYVVPAMQGRLDDMLHCVAANMVHPADKELFLHFCADMMSKAQCGQLDKGELECRKLRQSGQYAWVQLLVLPTTRGGDTILICYVQDISRRRAMEESTTLLQQICKATVLEEYGELGLIDVGDKLYVPQTLSGLEQGCATSYEAYVRATSAQVLKEDRRRYQAGMALEKVLRALNESGTFVMAVRRVHSGQPRWTSTRMTYFNGQRDTILCTVRDVHETHALEEENRTLLQSVLQSLGNLYTTITEIDPHKEKTTIVKSALLPDNEGRELQLDRFVRFLQGRLYHEDRAVLKAELTGSNLRRQLAGGSFHRSLEVRLARPEGGYEWQEINIFSILRGTDAASTALLTMHSVDERRLFKAIVDRLVYRIYDFFVCLDMQQDAYVLYSRSDESSVPLPPPRGKYSESVRNYVPKYVVEEDVARVLEAMTPERVRQELEHKDEYVIYCGLVQGGEYARKRYTFMYFDRHSQTVLVTRTDVSDVYSEEKSKSDLLREALLKAELASRAKTDFLSRMTHDIRTPMNAIMGMTAIARARLDEQERVAECLKKIDISSQFLLALINDVLDMSRIESGMMQISLCRFDLTDLLREITTLIVTQAASRGISFETSLGGSVGRFYSGDPLRINQVLVNLLSNALKHTRPGGKVRLDIEETERLEGGSRLCMTVSDTGAGMSREFMERMYEPFEQEAADTARTHAGTGLGLSIVRSLVSLMGGRIEVQSELGVGTSFAVHLDLNFPQGGEPGTEADRSELASLRVLLVDDDTISCEYMQLLFDGMGLEVAVASSGGEAVALVEQEWPDCPYDLVLVDWKMPDMDGEEVVRELRLRLGPNASFILMSAYDLGALQNIVLGGGADACLPKPVFRKALLDVLHRGRDVVLQRRRSLRGEQRLTGVHVLVVEDNEINMEIIKVLLEEEGARVEMAENGAVAVELFKHSSTPYDVILMDIRMPVMDGIEATRKIRALEDHSRRAVPIVAMSANAFQEDVEMARGAGVTHYLVKPVEVEKFYAQLDRVV